MTFAAAALRENFRAVNAARPVDTSSIKQTQIGVRIIDFCVDPGNASIEAFALQYVRNDQRDAIVETAQARERRTPIFQISARQYSPLYLLPVQCRSAFVLAAVWEPISSMTSETVS